MTDGICPFADLVIVDDVEPFGAGGPAKVGFVDHTAVGFFATLARASFWNGKGYSVHFGISLDGRLVQIVNIFDRAWGQGRLGPVVTWPPYDDMGRENPNEYMISIEHEDYAKVWNGSVWKAQHNGSVWTPEMFDADLRLKRWCVEEVARVQGADLLRFGRDSLAGHHHFDSVSRANCPGKPWRDDYRDRLLFALTESEEADLQPRIINEPGTIRNHLLWGRKTFFIPDPATHHRWAEFFGIPYPAPADQVTPEMWADLQGMTK